MDSQGAVLSRAGSGSVVRLVLTLDAVMVGLGKEAGAMAGLGLGGFLFP